MAYDESHGAKGKIELKHEWEETSSGHREFYEDAYLEAADDGNSVVLHEVKGEKNFIKMAKDESARRTSITVKELITLIKKHGKSV